MSETIRDQIKQNPSDFKCAHCNQPMPNRMSMTGGKAEMRKGMLMVCASCGNVSVLGDTNLHPMTKEEFLRLDMDTRKKLVMVAKGVRQLVQAGGSWSPFTNQ